MESDHKNSPLNCEELKISIHALRMESDKIIFLLLTDCGLHFYPRSPHGERLLCQTTEKKQAGFLSTLSAWRATKYVDTGICAKGISIHALRMESDHKIYAACYIVGNFYPRSPHGERRPYYLYV